MWLRHSVREHRIFAKVSFAGEKAGVRGGRLIWEGVLYTTAAARDRIDAPGISLVLAIPSVAGNPDPSPPERAPGGADHPRLYKKGGRGGPAQYDYYSERVVVVRPAGAARLKYD